MPRLTLTNGVGNASCGGWSLAPYGQPQLNQCTITALEVLSESHVVVTMVQTQTRAGGWLVHYICP